MTISIVTKKFCSSCSEARSPRPFSSLSTRRPLSDEVALHPLFHQCYHSFTCIASFSSVRKNGRLCPFCTPGTCVALFAFPAMMRRQERKLHLKGRCGASSLVALGFGCFACRSSKLQVPSTDTSRQLKEVSQAVLDLQPYRRNSSARNADGRMRLVDIFQGITLISDASSCSTAAATPAGSSTSADTTLVLDDFDPKMSRCSLPRNTRWSTGWSPCIVHAARSTAFYFHCLAEASAEQPGSRSILEFQESRVVSRAQCASGADMCSCFFCRAGVQLM